MTDTTRPFHWGRENPNYAGPTRAASSTANREVMGDISDIVSPGGYPVGSVAGRVSFFSKQADHPVTSEELQYAGVYDHPNAESVQAFRQLRVDALAELAAHTDANDLTREELAEVLDDEDFQDRCSDLVSDFMDRNGHLAREYVGLGANPVYDLALTGRREDGFLAMAPEWVRGALASGYAEAIADKYSRQGDPATDLRGVAAPGSEEEMAQEAWAETDTGGHGDPEAFSGALYRRAEARARQADNSEIYRLWAESGGGGATASPAPVIELEDMTRDLYADHARRIVLSSSWRAATADNTA